MIDSLRTTYNLCIFQIFILFPMLMLLVSVYGSPHNLKVYKPTRSRSPSPSLVETKLPVAGKGRTCLDMECSQDEQCLMLYPPCRSEPCPIPNPTCVSREPCNQLQCRKGQHCEVQNVVLPCLVPPCPGVIRPTCVLS